NPAFKDVYVHPALAHDRLAETGTRCQQDGNVSFWDLDLGKFE
ncbi:hypothetical protein LV83_03693, partial [Algoriphagus yeomjeoni]